MTAAQLSSGKGHKDENFPVASILIARQYRPAIMAFYRFARFHISTEITISYRLEKV